MRWWWSVGCGGVTTREAGVRAHFSLPSARSRGGPLRRCGGGQEYTTPLEPLLKRLAEDFIDDTDLSVRLQRLFKVGRRCRA